MRPSRKPEQPKRKPTDTIDLQVSVHGVDDAGQELERFGEKVLETIERVQELTVTLNEANAAYERLSLGPAGIIPVGEHGPMTPLTPSTPCNCECEGGGSCSPKEKA